MFGRGASIGEIAAETGRAISTTGEYLVGWIERARQRSVAPRVDDRTYSTILDSAARLAADRYRPIFEHFGGTVSYDQIRIAMTHARARAEATPPA